ncbi:hypothetical protein Slin15195_G026980 [Septoria linicola]|uniref:Uncharacterized protein n=1 Tax=Septoria linicola TaxID=215465 RepID=A0A9Q9EGX3_9PEZI|nr:hypothetical protein Slin15195_G026980 [Septoria linicola]
MANLAARKAGVAGKSTLVDVGGTPLWHPPASLQEESSLRSTLSHTEFDAPRNDVNTNLGGRTSTSIDQLQEPESSSPVYTYTSFTPINKRSGPLPNTPSSDHEPPMCILPTTSETFRQHYGRHIPEIKIDMYEVGEHELDGLEQDERRVYHIGLNKGGSYSGRLQQQPLKPELEQMISKTLGDNS